MWPSDELEEVLALALAARPRAPLHSIATRERRGREQDEEEVQPVDAELVVDAELGDPRLVGDVLQAAAGVEVDDERDGVAERAERAEQRDPARRRGAAARAASRPDDERQPEQEGQVQGQSRGLDQEVEEDAGDADEHERGVGAQEAGLAARAPRRCRRGRARSVPPTNSAVDDHALERRLREAAEPQRRAGR